MENCTMYDKMCANECPWCGSTLQKEEISRFHISYFNPARWGVIFDYTCTCGCNFNQKLFMIQKGNAKNESQKRGKMDTLTSIESMQL